MNKVQMKRLLNVAKALRDAHAARKKFNMEAFVFGNIGVLENNFNYETGEYEYCNTEANFCGTPACALGHYAARTDLQRLLKIVVVKDKEYGGVEYAKLAFFGDKASSDETCPDYEDPKFEEHFGLSSNEMEELFGNAGCGDARTALQAAKYIENFVKRKQHPGRNANSY